MSLKRLKLPWLLSFPSFCSFPLVFPSLLSLELVSCVTHSGELSLEESPWISRGLPACLPIFSGEARLTQLLWQPVFPRRAAKHVELLLRQQDNVPSWKSHSSVLLQKPPERAKAGVLLRSIPSGSISAMPFENFDPLTCSGPTMHP